MNGNNDEITPDHLDPDFAIRRQRARIEVDRLNDAMSEDEPDREEFYKLVYGRAGADAAHIPWADMVPKIQLSKWLSANPGKGKSAIDVACGLGDNAEEIAKYGYETIAFDLASKAIDWAKRRFSTSNVDYRVASLFEPPAQWREGFDLVNECYTLQTMPPKMLSEATKAIAALVKPGGDLLIYTRIRPQGTPSDGPPWAMQPSDIEAFAAAGFKFVSHENFDIVRGERKIPHQFAHWQKIL